ncbi:MAG TPA: STAS domain-containing protein [Acidimicrobiales bacterium]|nr:STAS domain-containing protein [Acidimicrobiales bacterium]
MEHANGFSLSVSATRVKITGELDVSTTPSMIEAVIKAMTVELDISEVTFVDSTGLHALIQLRNRRSELRIVAISPPVKRLLEMTGISSGSTFRGAARRRLGLRS